MLTGYVILSKLLKLTLVFSFGNRRTVYHFIYRVWRIKCAKKFLNSLGFIIGEGITVVSDLGGNLIVNIKGANIHYRNGQMFFTILKIYLLYNALCVTYILYFYKCFKF